MSYSLQSTKFFRIIPKSVLIVLSSLFGMGLFTVGFDQGHTLSLIYGESAYVNQFLHELTHDMRHAAGFPCH